MAIKLVSSEYCPCQDKNVHRYIMDAASDVASLPACCTGSTAVVATKDDVMYIVNASGEWKEI